MLWAMSVSFIKSFPNLLDKKGHLEGLLKIHIPQALRWGASENGRWSLGAPAF